MLSLSFAFAFYKKRRFAYCLRYRLVQPRTRAIVTRIVFFTSSTDEPLVVTFAKTRILYYNCGGWELTKNIDVRVEFQDTGYFPLRFAGDGTYHVTRNFRRNFDKYVFVEGKVLFLSVRQRNNTVFFCAIEERKKTWSCEVSLVYMK